VSEKMTSRPPEPKPAQNGQLLGRWHQRLHANPALALLTKIVVSVVGFAVLLLGVITIVTPGPAVVLIPLGLAILSSEYDWARRWLAKAKQQALKARARSAAQDPGVRRRRRLLAALTFVVVAGGVATYVAFFDWPSWAQNGWDWAQGRAGWLPDLPGM
jgi:uncharacterized protein (TIGR02611 family)